MNMFGTNADWFARLLGIFAILISGVNLYLRIRQAQQQRPILKVEQSEILIQEDFDAHSRKLNSDLLKRDSSCLFIPMEVNILIKNEGLTAAAVVTDMEISLEFTPRNFIEKIRLFVLEKLRKRGRALGGIMYFGVDDEPLLHLIPGQSPMRLPTNVEAGSFINCKGTLYLELRMTDKLFKDFKRVRRQLRMPLDCIDFVISGRGHDAEQARFALELFSGSKILFKAIFQRNKYFVGYWFCHG